MFKNRKPVLKFYEPKSKKLILYEDNTDYKCHFYVTDEQSLSMKEMVGVDSVRSIEIFDVVRDELRAVSKVTVNNPMIKYDLKEAGIGWETDIKFYQDYIYDNNYIVGTWYDIDENLDITPIKSTESSFNLSNIDMDSVVDTDKFSSQVTKWANLLGQNIPSVRRMAFDIEVESSRDSLPDSSTALNRVTAISFHGSDGLAKVFTLRRPEITLGDEDENKNYDLVWYDSEKKMLEDSFELIDSYPLILTYNGDMFDMPYLYNRANILGIDYNPFKMMAKKATLNNGIHIDLYGVFSNPSLKTYAFNAKYVEDKLGTVSQALLGETKTEYEGELNDIPLFLLSKYCYNDSRLTFELSHFNNDLVMNMLIILCRIGNMPIDDISRLKISNWIRSMFYFEHRINNQLIPKSSDFPKVESSTTAAIKGKKYQGAVVIEPTAGIHFDVTVLDFASLYPSIMKTRNISYETICCPHEECKTNKIPNTNHWSCRKKIGIASLLIGSLKELRVNHFKALSKDKTKTQQERDINDLIAQALKVYLNASYGVMGADTFDLYFLPSAESITAVGRDIILKIIEIAKENGVVVLYGDTDSVFTYKPTKEQIDLLIEYCSKNYSIDLEVDKEYKYLVLSDRKKNYFGIKKDNSLDIKGLTGKKSNTPIYLRELFYDIIETLKKIEIPSDFVEAKNVISNKIKNIYENFDTIPLEKLVFRVMIKQEPSEYKKNKPQNIKAAEQLPEKPYKGQFVSFVKTWNEPHVKPLVLAKRSDIDKEKYFENFESTLEQIVDPMDIDIQFLMGKGKQTTLFQW